MRVDNVQDRGPLPDVEVQFAKVGVVLLEPEAQQLGCHRRDVIEQLRAGAVGNAGDQRINNCREPFGEWEVSEATHDRASTPEMTTSDSKPNTSTARTQTVRGCSTRVISSSAAVTTRNSSPSLSVLPR